MEGIDSSWDFGYLRHETEANMSLDEISQAANGVYHLSISLRELSSLIEYQIRPASTENQGPDFSNDSLNCFPQSGTISQVYLTDRSGIVTRIAETVAEFQLNKKQSLAFKIVDHHSMSLDLNLSFRLSELSPNNQLLMGMFSKGGTGKSRAIDVICK